MTTIKRRLHERKYREFTISTSGANGDAQPCVIWVDYNCNASYGESNIADPQVPCVDTEVVNFIFRKKCERFYLCNKMGKMMSPNYNVVFSTSCDGSPIMPKEDNTMNGLVCPTCRFRNNEKCVPNSAMKCTGAETFCFDYTNGLSFGQILGCASMSYCMAYSFIGDVKLQEYTNPRASCTKSNQTSSLPVVNYLLCYECHRLMGRRCNPNPTLCSPDQDACLSILTQTTYGLPWAAALK
ncbi:uncharacterized protein LOC142498173 [Ascaphus truei]|uniref:uncharacterized protein LOC142498173 n=1 Tax=Ascaphus truei TaxID=8439 RepID=UPI003F5938EA